MSFSKNRHLLGDVRPAVLESPDRCAAGQIRECDGSSPCPGLCLALQPCLERLGLGKASRRGSRWQRLTTVGIESADNESVDEDDLGCPPAALRASSAGCSAAFLIHRFSRDSDDARSCMPFSVARSGSDESDQCPVCASILNVAVVCPARAEPAAEIGVSSAQRSWGSITLPAPSPAAHASASSAKPSIRSADPKGQQPLAGTVPDRGSATRAGNGSRRDAVARRAWRVRRF